MADNNYNFSIENLKRKRDQIDQDINNLQNKRFCRENIIKNEDYNKEIVPKFEFRQKKLLQEQISQLSEENLLSVIGIIQTYQLEILETTEGEYCFDVNLLKDETIHRLFQFLNTPIYPDFNQVTTKPQFFDNTMMNNNMMMHNDFNNNILNFDNFFFGQDLFQDYYFEEVKEVHPVFGLSEMEERINLKVEDMEMKDNSSERTDDECMLGDSNSVEGETNDTKEECDLKEETVDVVPEDNGNDSAAGEVSGNGNIVVTFMLYDLRPKEGEKKAKKRCPKCKKEFKDKSNLIKHIRTHTGEKPYKCDYCGKCFRHTSTRNDHLNIHLNRNPHVCDYEGCNKQFANAANLKRHKRIHTGEKPYKCKYCDKRFTQSTNCKQHEKIHNKGK